MKNLMLMLLVALFASTAHAQDDPNNPPAQAEQRTQVEGTKLTISFPGDWNVEEKDGKTIAASPDDSIHVFASELLEDADGNNLPASELVAGYLVEFKLMKDAKKRTIAGEDDIALISGSGTAKSKADDTPVAYKGDMVGIKDSKGAVVLAYGSDEALQKYAASIEQIRDSYEKAN